MAAKASRNHSNQNIIQAIFNSMARYEDIKRFDEQYAGRMNPRNSYHCKVCGFYYNGWAEVTVICSSNSGDAYDCVHREDRQIHITIYQAHMKILKENGIDEQKNPFTNND